MKVLFLDIDGVLNCRYTVERYRRTIGIDPSRLALLKEFLERHEMKIVLSSTWRLFEDRTDHVREHIDIYSTTPCLNTSRGIEIRKWMQEHPDVTAFLIIDDDSDMLPEQLPHYIQTNMESGLTADHIEQMEKCLQEQVLF